MPYADVVVDLSHHNGKVDLAQAGQNGVIGVIHKATQGTLYVDPLYHANLAQASAANLLWGAYHFGVSGDGVAQAEFFLDTVKPIAHTLLVLDFEGNPHGASMDIE